MLKMKEFVSEEVRPILPYNIDTRRSIAHPWDFRGDQKHDENLELGQFSEGASEARFRRSWKYIWKTSLIERLRERNWGVFERCKLRIWWRNRGRVKIAWTRKQRVRTTRRFRKSTFGF